MYTRVGDEFFTRHCWGFQDWALAVCSQYYQGAELLLYILCHVFHRHVLVVCQDRYWCTFDNPEDMSISEILDACDLHFIHLRPGIFSELHQKTHHRSLTSFSPPEFPKWTTNPANSPDNSILTEMENLDENINEFNSNNLLKTFLNVSGGDANLHSQYTKGGSSEARPCVSSNLDVAGNNTTNSGNELGQNNVGFENADNILDERAGLVLNTNPISIKENCVYSLVRNMINKNPPSLFGICVDYISWNSTLTYNCSMKLPQSMNTATHMIKLVHHAPQKYTPCPRIRQVTLYDEVKIDPRVKDYLLQQACSRNYKVVLKKLTVQNINGWTTKPRNTWEHIDPYSDIKDIGDSIDMPNEHSSDEENLNDEPIVTEKSTSRYSLHSREPKTCTNKCPGVFGQICCTEVATFTARISTVLGCYPPMR